jgi:hypothetical protein
MAGEYEVLQLARNLWDKYIKHRVKETQKNTVRYFRAKVTATAQNGKISVQKPFDTTTLNLPYVSSASGLAVNDECIVLVLGDYNNCIVLGDGKLSNL